MTQPPPRTASQPTTARSERIIVLDFGSQYAQLIARRVREQNVFCEIVRHDLSADRIRGFLDSAGSYAQPLAGLAGRMDGTPDVLRVIARRLAGTSAAAASPATG